MAAPTIDGTNSALASSTTTCSVALTTTNSNDIIVVIPGCEAHQTGGPGPAVSSVTATGLTFTRRVRAHGSTEGNIEIWWALAASPLSAVNITATFASTFDNATILAFGVSGCNTTTPWDSNVGLPQTFSYNTTATPSYTLNTNHANDLILFVTSVEGAASGLPGDPTGFTLVTSKSNLGGQTGYSSRVVSKGVTAVQTNVTVAASSAGTTPFPAADNILDVLTADANTQSFTYTPSGGFTLGGTAVVLKSAVVTPTGGLIFSGAANIIEGQPVAGQHHKKRCRRPRWYVP